MASLVGSRVERKEDTRFLQGKGRYTADINIANQTYAVFVRSPHARAKIKSVDTSKALKSSGVVGVLTGKEIGLLKLSLSLNQYEEYQVRCGYKIQLVSFGTVFATKKMHSLLLIKAQDLTALTSG